MHQSQILFTTNLTFKIDHLELTEDIMVFEKLSGILLGFPFFDKNEITIDAHNHYLHFPEFTFHLNLMRRQAQKHRNDSIISVKFILKQPLEL